MSGLINITNNSDTPENQVQWCGNQEGIIIWTCFSMISFVVGFPASVAVLWNMIERRRKRHRFSPYDVFVINATVMDGILLLSTLPEVYNNLQGHSTEYEAFVTFLFPFNQCGRPLFITCICVDCYLAVVHPVVYHANKSLTPRVLTAAGVWTITLLCGGISVGYFGLENHIQVLFFTLTFPIIGFCDISIIWTLKRSNPAGESVHPKKKKAQQVVINNLIITFTSYVPPVIGVLISKFLNMDEDSLYCYVILPMFCSLLAANAVSPILYLNNLGKLDWLKGLTQR